MWRAALMTAMFAVILAGLHTACWGYQWPLRQFGTSHPITGTLGEYRTGEDRVPNTTDDHLHSGVDIGGGTGTEVYPAVGGTVEAKGYNFVKVRDGARAIDYVHIVPQVNEGQTVTAGVTVLGMIDSRNHLHFRENGGAANPLRPGGLTPYTDTSAPVVLSIEVVKDGTAGGGSPFPDTLGCPKVQGRADIKVKARDPQSYGSQKTAPYRIGYEIRAEDGEIVEPAVYKIQFSSVDGYSLGLVYSETDSDDSTYVYWATNRPDANEYWDSEDLWDGWYWIYAYAEDIAGNESSGGSRVVATERVKVWVDGNIAARLVGEWAYRSGGDVVVGWNAEVERKTAGYLIEGKRAGAWHDVGKADRADAVVPGVYEVGVDEACDRYRVVEVDSIGRRQGFKSFGVSDGPPRFLARLVENALAGEARARAGSGCCLAGSDEAEKALAAITETVPDWVFYGPDSLLAECGPAVSWFEAKGQEVALVSAPVPDH
jgi:hypothetical protein